MLPSLLKSILRSLFNEATSVWAMKVIVFSGSPLMENVFVEFVKVIVCKSTMYNA